MNEKRNILITGAAGYIGSLLIESLRDREYISLILATDVKEPRTNIPEEKIRFFREDVRSPALGDLMLEYQVETVVHLAAVVTPGKKSDRELEYSVDVLGTKNVLECCLKAGVKQIIITSSGAAYGYYPDSPEWLTEDDPIRGNREFAYSHHKRLVEEMLKEYRQKYPELKQLIFRPGTILGKTTHNQITALFHKSFILGIRRSTIPFVFIWDEDVVRCIEKGIREESEGIYNLAGDGVVTMKEIAEMVNRPYLPVPASLVKGILWVLKKLRLSQYGPEQVNFLRYRPVLSNKRLKEEFGYTPEKTSHEVFEYYLSHNK